MKYTNNATAGTPLSRNEDCFFLIASDRLEEVETRLYGFAVEDSGIYDSENFSAWTEDRFCGAGTYVYVKRTPEGITIRQDCSGNMGLLLCRSGDGFVIGNSFFRMADYLKDKAPLTPDMDFMKQLLTTDSFSLSARHTAIREIRIVPPRTSLHISVQGELRLEEDPVLRGVPLDSEEGMRRLDHWVGKWTRILRGLAEQGGVWTDAAGDPDGRLISMLLRAAGADRDRIRVSPRGKASGAALAAEYRCRLPFSKTLSPRSAPAEGKRVVLSGFGEEALTPCAELEPDALLPKECGRIRSLPEKTAQDYAGAIYRILTDTYDELREGPADAAEETAGRAMFRDCCVRQSFGRDSTAALAEGICLLAPLLDPLLLTLEGAGEGLLPALILQRYCPGPADVSAEGESPLAEETRARAAELCGKYPRREEAEPASAVRLPVGAAPAGEAPRTGTAELERRFLDVFSSPTFRADFSASFGGAFYSFLESAAERTGTETACGDVYAAVACMEVIDLTKANGVLLASGLEDSLRNLSAPRAADPPTGLGERTPMAFPRTKTDREKYTILDVYEGEDAGEPAAPPKVSVIVPTYNVEMYLVQALESLQKQTLRDMEFICINDGSTDSSLEIIKSFARKDRRFVVCDKPNGGYGIGMNTGLELARGEYVGILEPDDYVPLEMFEELYRTASENDLDFVKADFYRFSTEEDGSMNLVYNHLDDTGKYYDRVLDPSRTPELIKLIMNTWSGIYRRAFLREHNIRHNTTPGASFQDNGFFWQTFIYARRAMFLDKPFYMNRRDNPNSSVKSKDKVYAANVEYDHIRDILLQDPVLWERFRSVYYLKRFGNCCFTMERISDEFKMEYARRSAADFRRAKARGELDMTAFPAGTALSLQFLLQDPEEFCRRYYVYPEELQEIALKEAKRRRLMAQMKTALLILPKKAKRLAVKLLRVLTASR